MSYRDNALENIQIVADTLSTPRTPVDALSMVSVAMVAQAQASLAVADELAALRRAVTSKLGAMAGEV